MTANRTRKLQGLTVATLGLLLALPAPAVAKDRAGHAQQLKTLVHQLRQQRKIRIAHPDVAKRLSQDVSKSLGRTVTIRPEQIIQVQFDSSAHHALKAGLGGTLGVGIYPSRAYGHNKLRVGSHAADSVPLGSRAFPSTGTKARFVPFGKMHKRFYEAVFPGSSAELGQTAATARQVSTDLKDKGMNCASFVGKILKDAHGTAQQAYNGKLSTMMGTGSAGNLWNKAVGASPAYILVYSPKGDFRSVDSPKFTFDYRE